MTGGKREGSGRKKLGKVVLYCSVSPTVKMWLSAIAERAHCSIGEALEVVVLTHKLQMGKK